MALKLTFERSGVTYTDSYHRVTFGPRDKVKKELIVFVKIYASKTYADAHPDDFIDHELIRVAPEDFDTYFAMLSYEDGDLYPEKQGYEFLKTIDPGAVDTRYPFCRFNYLDAEDVIE